MAKAPLIKINERRRNLLKLVAFGSATFVLGKVLGPSINLFGGRIAEGEITDFKNFRVLDNEEELGFYDKLGNEILIIEKNEGGTI